MKYKIKMLGCREDSDESQCPREASILKMGLLNNYALVKSGIHLAGRSVRCGKCPLVLYDASGATFIVDVTEEITKM